jgi:hypothetical protein
MISKYSIKKDGFEVFDINKSNYLTIIYLFCMEIIFQKFMTKK